MPKAKTGEAAKDSERATAVTICFMSFSKSELFGSEDYLNRLVYFARGK